MWDYSNKPGVALFARALVNVVNQSLSSGAPVLDYLYLDGPDWQPLPNISKARNAQLKADKMAFFADLQNQFDALPGGQRNILLNGVDTVETAKAFNPTGASGVMIDHWTILQVIRNMHVLMQESHPHHLTLPFWCLPVCCSSC